MTDFKSEVVHFEDEKMVGIVCDYRTAGAIMWLLGYATGGRTQPTSVVFEMLDGIEEVEKWYQKCYDILKGDMHCIHMDLVDWNE